MTMGTALGTLDTFTLSDDLPGGHSLWAHKCRCLDPTWEPAVARHFPASVA